MIEWILQKRTVLVEDSPESSAIEGSKDNQGTEVDPNWPPARPHKKRHISPAADDSEAQTSEDDN